MYKCKIQLVYAIKDEANLQGTVAAVSLGAATGISLQWFQVGAVFISVPSILVAFLFRSFGQQMIHARELEQFHQKLLELLNNNKEIRETIPTIIIESQGAGVNNNLNNHQRVELKPSLNWDTNPEIQKAAQQLGIFKNPPNPNGKLNLDPADPKSIQFLEELGIDTNPIGIGKKERPKGKTVYFRDLIDRNHGVAYSDIIDAEIVLQPEQIQVKNKY